MINRPDIIRRPLYFIKVSIAGILLVEDESTWNTYEVKGSLWNSKNEETPRYTYYVERERLAKDDSFDVGMDRFAF